MKKIIKVIIGQILILKVFLKIIANNEIVFLDITADWCITCKFNKINVLNSKTVSDFFDSQEVTLIKADWTQPNEKINKFLKKYNKFGIPFNAFYSSKFPEGIVMNEILTEWMNG